eukprot:jgi/Mesvir1/21782/Mv04178-RA.1
MPPTSHCKHLPQCCSLVAVLSTAYLLFLTSTAARSLTHGTSRSVQLVAELSTPSSRCPAGCSQVGTCDEQSGVCVCPPWKTGPDCSQPALPSCMEGVFPLGLLGCGGFLTSCDCIRECDERGLYYSCATVTCVELHRPAEARQLTREDMRNTTLTDLGLLVTYRRGVNGKLGRVVAPATKKDRNNPFLPSGEAPYVPQSQCADECHGEGLCVRDREGERCKYVKVLEPCLMVAEGPHDQSPKPRPVPDMWRCDQILNNCSNAGICDRGFCRCVPGRFGIDCSLATTHHEGRHGQDPIPAKVEHAARVPDYSTYVLREGAYVRGPEPPNGGGHMTWVPADRATVGATGDESRDGGNPGADVVLAPAAHGSGGGSVVPRPRIYVYELPPRFTSGMHFVWFLHLDGRLSENAVHLAALLSQHRVTDAKEADFFFVPTWSRRAPLDWQTGMGYHRDIVAHIRSAYPYWDAKGGRDHIFVSSSDFGACGTHKQHAHMRLGFDPDLASAIWLHHFGLTVADMEGYDTGPCHIPGQDIVIPSNSFLYQMHEYNDIHKPFFKKSPLFERGGVVRPAYWADPAHTTGEAPRRHPPFDTLLFFAGASGLPNSGPHSNTGIQYSHNVRQRVFQLFEGAPGVELSRRRVPDYAGALVGAKFCLAPSGAGFGIRTIDAVIMGCVPVIVQDNVEQPFEDYLPYERFSVRLNESQIPFMLDILRGIDDATYARMQRELECCMTRFIWRGMGPSTPLPPGPDAFATVMEILRNRVEGRPNQRLASCCYLDDSPQR